MRQRNNEEEENKVGELYRQQKVKSPNGDTYRVQHENGKRRDRIVRENMAREFLKHG